MPPKPRQRVRSGNNDGHGGHDGHDGRAHNHNHDDHKDHDDHNDSGDSGPSDSLASTFSGTAYMLVQQLLTRALTFGLNVFLTRLSPLETMGFVLQLELCPPPCCLSRARASAWPSCAIPRLLQLLPATATTSKSSTSSTATSTMAMANQLAFNMALIPSVLACVGIAAYLAIFDPSSAAARHGPASDAVSLPHAARLIYLAAAIIELLAEPSFILLQRNLLYKERVRTEGSAFVVQCITTLALFLAAQQASPSGRIGIAQGVMAHAYAQLAFAVVLLVGYTSRAVHARLLPSLIPRPVLMAGTASKTPKSVYLDPYHISIAVSFFFQTLIKHLLTVGDKIVLVAVGTGSADQGIYRMVSDLGSLVARILFQPVEETSRAFFSKSLTNTVASPRLADTLREVFDYLVTVVQLHLLLGGFFVLFAPNYASTLLGLLFAKSGPEAARVLAVYCLYVPVMGINGITEAFLQGVGDERVVRRQSVLMVGFWAVFVAVSYLLLVVVDMGTSGLVVANTVNMAMRIVFSAAFIHSFFALENETGRLLPADEQSRLAAGFRTRLALGSLVPGGLLLWAAFAASGAVTWASHYAATHWWTDSLGRLGATVAHIGIGGLCAIAVLACL
ncbi:Rft protein-domain-containing protein [Entophlyctis helioformis]|nr:Rft protein-domain-containing protein [Entophlyctis helioformis]